MRIPTFSRGIKFKLMVFIFLIILSIVLIFAFYSLRNLKENLYEEKRLQTQKMVKVSLGVLRRFHKLEQNGLLTEEHAQNQALITIENMIYGPGNQNYYWIQNKEPVMLMHPYAPELVDKYIGDIQDQEGKYLFREMIQIIEQQNGGYLEYYWQYYEVEDRIEPKLSYIEEFEPWGWIIGTGVYINDIEAAYADSRNDFILIGIGVLFFVLFLTYILSSYFTEPLILVADTLEQFNDYDLKLTNKSSLNNYRNRKDEIGEMIENLFKMRSNLKNMIKRMQITQFSVDYAALGIFWITPEGKIEYVNNEICKMLNYSQEELVGKRISDIDPNYWKGERKARWALVKEKGTEIIQTKLETKEGKKIHVQITSCYLKYGDKDYEFTFAQDITKLKQKEKAIKNLHAIAVDFKKAKDKQKVCEMTIEAAENLLDFNFSDISLVEDKLLIPRATTSNAQSKKMAITEGIAGKTYRRGESFVTDNIANNPEAKPVKNSYKSVISIPVGDYGVFQAVRVGKETFTKTDIELAELLISHTTVALERIGYEEELKYKSFHDELTGLYNRRFLSEEVKRLNTERQLPISIIMLDINDLKIINDSLGYNKGDELIVKTAKILKDSVRKEDILARYGGDEFVILLTQTRREKAVEIMERIKRRCEKTNEEELSVSLGAGIATKNNVEQDIDNIFKKANNALNQNKLLDNRSRKNRLVLNLLNTLSTKSDETRNHAARMADLAYKLGIKLGIPHSELDRLSLLASLHDIGKISISEEILIKPGELTEEEWEIIREHPERGYKIASASEEFAVIAQEILAHHERWDGEGYPQGLQGENIPYLARIISIIDAYDVMTHARPYSKAISKQEALAEIKRCAGSQFDPKLAEIFVEMMKEK
ncbi:MAG: diguanylate cyclase [Halanaerobiales bacterium]|nr:diguanylate cyclase [Halanaerobiales bacterium]